MKPMRARFEPKESILVRRLRDQLHTTGWLTEKTHGGAFVSGLPDLFCWHPTHGLRWVEVKRPKGGRLTPAQVVKFARWETFRLAVYVLCGPQDVPLLFGPPNWREWLPAPPRAPQAPS